MSTSYNCEGKLRELADKLHDKAYELEKAADVLRVLREADDFKLDIIEAKKWAKDWMRGV